MESTKEAAKGKKNATHTVIDFTGDYNNQPRNKRKANQRSSMATDAKPIYKITLSSEAFVLADEIEAITKITNELAGRIKKNSHPDIKDISTRLRRHVTRLNTATLKKWIEENRFNKIEMTIDTES